MRNIWTIAKREYQAYFTSFAAYFFAFLILLVIGIVTTRGITYSLNYFGQVPPPGVDYVLGPMIFILFLACPALTMRLLSEEQRLGTIELLLTAPIRDAEVVVGKWFGSFLMVLTLIALTLIYPAALNLMTSPGIDQGLMITGYLGLMLISAVFLSIGVAVSSLFSNQIVSFLVTFAIILFFWIIFGIFAQTGSGNTFISFLDLGSHFDNFMQGVITLSSVVFYLTLTAAFLLLGTVSVETRRWR
jgi:ABC-2 type transport system permease protein